jgi:hypothetical protein
MELFLALVFALALMISIGEAWHERDWPRSTFIWTFLTGIAFFGWILFIP